MLTHMEAGMNFRQLRIDGILPVCVAVAINLPTSVSLAQERGAFAAERVERGYQYPSGKFVAAMRFTFGMKSDGSYAQTRMVTSPDGRAVEVKFVVDVPLRRRIAVDHITNSITTTYLPAHYADFLGNPDSSCSTSPVADPPLLLGYEVRRVVEKNLRPGGEVHQQERWLAPALGCMALREKRWMAKYGGPLVLVFDKEVTSLTLGEPPAALFEIPAGLVERSPQAVLNEFQRLSESLPVRRRVE